MKTENKKKQQDNYFAFDFVKITGAIPALLWMRPKVVYTGEKKLKKGGFLITANHNSLTDPLLVLCVFWKRHMHCLATKDLYRTKFMNKFLPLMKCIQVDKENFTINSFHEVVRRLKGGKIVLIFPEGRVDASATEVAAFKSGAILMAHRSNVPILPIYIAKPQKWYSRRVVVIGDPFNVRDYCGVIPKVEDLERTSDELKNIEENLKIFYEEKIKKEKKEISHE